MQVKIPRKIATVGMFDGVHLGHHSVLNYLLFEGKKNTLEPIVFTFKNHPLTIINPTVAPQILTTSDEKISMLQNAGISNCIFLEFNDKLRNLSAKKFLSMLHNKYYVDALILGFNNKIGHDGISDFNEYCQLGNEIGIKILKAPELKHTNQPISSSSIRKLLLDHNIKQANNLLGYKYFISGKVIYGKQLGRKIGFPTANIQPNSNYKLIPPVGVYAVIVTTPDNKRHPAMLNIGSRPTVDTPNAPISIEAHLFNFKADLYNTDLKIEFIDFIRPERQFSSIDHLKNQLQEDKNNATKIISDLSAH